MPNALYNQAAAALQSPLVNAFLDAGIRPGEGTADANGYRRLFGGGNFSDFSHHPNQTISAGGYRSTAAGAFQFLYSTWVNVARALALPDFSPLAQRLGAVYLLSQNGALPYILQGDWPNAVARARGTWPSLPGGSQQRRTWTQFNAQMANAGATPVLLPDPIAPPAPGPAILPLTPAAPDLGISSDTLTIVIVGLGLLLVWSWWE